MVMRHRRLGVALIALLVSTTAVSCSAPGDSDQGGDDSEVLRGLTALSSRHSRGKAVTYLDMARVRQLEKDGGERYSSVATPATSLLTGFELGPWQEHLKPSQIDTAVDWGTAGHWEGRFDSAAITRALKSNGYVQKEEDGRRYWRTEDSTLALQVSDHEISYAAQRTDPMSVVHPEQGAALADKEEYRRAAECLGDVYRADFLPLKSAKPTRLSALGQRAASAEKNTEILCAVVKDEATAERVATRLRSVVREKAPQYDGTKITVENGERPYVRAVVPDKASQRPGRLLFDDVELWLAVND
jgi:hypothetical protein